MAETSNDRVPHGDPDLRWLATQELPARGAFSRASTLTSLGVLFAVIQAVAIGWSAQLVLDGRSSAVLLPAALFALGGLASAGCARAAASRTREGRSLIHGHLQSAVLQVVLPDHPKTAAAGSPAVGAHALLELTDQVAEYHSLAAPIRREAPGSMVLVIAAVAVLNWPCAVILLVCAAIMPFSIRITGLVAQEESSRQLSAMRRLSAIVLDSFRGLHTLRNYGAVDDRRRVIERASDQLNDRTEAVLRKAFLSGLVMDAALTFALAISATYVGFALLGYVRVPGAPTTLFAGLSALILCPMFFQPLRAISAGYHARDKALAAATVLRELVEEPQPRDQLDMPAPLGEPVAITVRDVAFQYVGADISQLSGLDVELEAGSWTAITGPSGSGKTTMLSLLAGLLRPSSGEVIWHRGAEGQMAPQLGAASWIGQDTVVIDGTLEMNIRLGNPSATPELVRHAAHAAGLEDLILMLPDGLQARVGDGGSGLSAGEARRIAIARAVVKGSLLWILDEPTQHLDRRTENDVLSALRVAADGATVIIATHSPAVVERCDHHIQVDDNRAEVVRLSPAARAS